MPPSLQHIIQVAYCYYIVNMIKNNIIYIFRFYGHIVSWQKINKWVRITYKPSRKKNISVNIIVNIIYNEIILYILFCNLLFWIKIPFYNLCEAC